MSQKTRHLPSTYQMKVLVVAGDKVLDGYAIHSPHFNHFDMDDLKKQHLMALEKAEQEYKDTPVSVYFGFCGGRLVEIDDRW